MRLFCSDGRKRVHPVVMSFWTLFQILVGSGIPSIWMAGSKWLLVIGNSR
jgi:hypothetical protein